MDKAAIERFLKSDGFKANVHGDAFDKGTTRVYFDDNEIVISRFDNPKNRILLWKNRIDGNMPVDAIESLLFTMSRIGG